MKLEHFIVHYNQWETDNGRIKFKDFELFMKKLRFKKIGSGAYKTVFSMKTRDYVVKVNHAGCEDQCNLFVNFKPKDAKQKKVIGDHCLPMIFLNENKSVMIQPKVSRLGDDKVVYELSKKFDDVKIIWGDIQQANCGVYKNRPVIIDGTLTEKVY